MAKKMGRRGTSWASPWAWTWFRVFRGPKEVWREEKDIWNTRGHGGPIAPQRSFPVLIYSIGVRGLRSIVIITMGTSHVGVVMFVTSRCVPSCRFDMHRTPALWTPFRLGSIKPQSILDGFQFPFRFAVLNSADFAMCI